MNKHAYLIICHLDNKNLETLIKSIDDSRNDIFVFVDKKTKNFNFDKYSKLVSKSKISFVKRINNIWGSYTQIQTEMILLEAAKPYNYDYYHLLSGVDMCIKSQDYIHDFFDKNRGKEFITFCGHDWQDEAQNRVKYFYLAKNRKVGFKALINKIYVTMQKVLHIKRRIPNDFKIVGGSNWVSITDDLVKYILDSKKIIKKYFSHGYLVDELFIHSLAYNSKFKDNIYYLNNSLKNDDSDKTMYEANQRYIDWVRGKPYTFKDEDFNELVSSNYCFARKFTYSNDNKVIDKIFESIKK